MRLTEPYEDGTKWTRIPTWEEGIERLLGKLPELMAKGAITINDARVIQYLANRVARDDGQHVSS